MMTMMIKYLLLTLLVISPICAEKDLMIKECNNAQVPTICMQCLESDPTSVHADRVGIADIIIHCLDSRLHIITNNITNLLSRERKREVKTVLKACENELSTVGPNTLSEAETALTTGDYDKTAKSIKLALGIPHGCRFELQRIKFESFELYSQINIYTQLSDAAMRIIDRF
ncbi:unnamed protein product [Arabidopsis lyrata]|uniref:pectinesterase inhibitor isoform X1 n=1 Tax=Arabidopsis lyrata subsp. lyrata TaxID=81972 RepID=UPI000A29B642|nr:pectinesterase inhibitor isoform X1 [Arabidopsis lyrata subsp. lyrata]CAH8255754.1 unnamed protein product [Arabidopsis lyrata]|eukprot:XP_020866799.1 pectinesterase inhibitor isoform X1 [Arabidopsis lyrata subsp. lyrata]